MKIREIIGLCNEIKVKKVFGPGNYFKKLEIIDNYAKIHNLSIIELKKLGFDKLDHNQISKLLSKLKKLDPESEYDEEYIKSVPLYPDLNQKNKIESNVKLKALTLKENKNDYFGRYQHYGTPIGLIVIENVEYIIINHYTTKNRNLQEDLKDLNRIITKDEYELLLKNDEIKAAFYDEIYIERKLFYGIKRGYWLYGKKGDLSLLKVNENQYVSQVVILVELTEESFNRYYKIYEINMPPYQIIKDSNEIWLKNIIYSNGIINCLNIEKEIYLSVSINEVDTVKKDHEYYVEDIKNFELFKKHMYIITEKSNQNKYTALLLIINYLKYMEKKGDVINSEKDNLEISEKEFLKIPNKNNNLKALKSVDKESSDLNIKQEIE